MNGTDLHGPEAVLQFWYGELTDGLMPAQRRASLFRADPAFDAEIAARFGSEIDAALDGERDAWAGTVRGRAALLLLLDQFTRNVFRGSPRAYAGDHRALGLAIEGVSRGDDRLLPVEMRAFCYLPFEHSEQLADQDTCVTLFEQLLTEQLPGSSAAAAVQGYLHHAREHRELIRRFGRFPHRNAILNRTATDAERHYLEQDGRRFGQ